MHSILFWAVTVAMTLAVAGLMVAALIRGRMAGASPAAAFDLKVYRDQLAEVERDLARGVIAEEEAARLRTEIGRRVLAADQAMQVKGTAQTGGPARALAAVGLMGAIAAIGFGAYAWLGHPGLGDMPLSARLASAEAMRADRPRQPEAEVRAAAALPPAPQAADPRHAELMVQLRKAMTERPNDLRGQELLARNEAMLGNYGAAARAQGMVVALKGPVATADDLAVQAELMVAAAGGLVTPEAESVLAAALEKDAANGMARYYSGLMFTQTGRFDLAFRFWAPLWQSSTEADPWVAALRAELPDVAWLAGQHRYEMPPLRSAPLPGPDADAIAASRDMSPEDRQQMIRGMVDGLMNRLATEGGTAPEWARLIRALGVLGDTDRAKAIWGEAQERFQGREADLAEVTAAAREAGLIK
ncbi:cytochrome c-type biogenesis protein CcmH [Gemmobacter megaterium]|uniref:Cytochrome c-type biogenesis protein CcmH n=1 Tax=Gemmobacter megaterium TaxID=1086013 RepID=A0A1N7KWK0_9RHOB|nr:c-type cytochrome biogenesis protein CcmI [Gemmobacter megaterium]GGE04207.1 c-type cytochrome biogenesis protein CcmI [Gemmobacter megaterium]SIS65944.1 cytochrome c-type biogenesis protein CcmH [Gemmobacter megaterium]